MRRCLFTVLTLLPLQLWAAELLALETVAELTASELREPSGIVASRRFDDLFWVHPDSGHPGNIFAIRKNGSLVQPPEVSGVYTGIYVEGAVNLDWEDIAADDEGQLYLGDIGDNLHFRPFLSVYQVPEPNPLVDTRIKITRRMDLYFPKGTRERNVEALVFAQGALHLLSKHRRDGFTTLYRHQPGEKVLKEVARYPVQSQVTAADYDAVHRRLAVLTYDGIWMFNHRAEAQSLFEGEVFRRDYSGTRSAEALALGADGFLILDEKKRLYEVDLSVLRAVE